MKKHALFAEPRVHIIARQLRDLRERAQTPALEREERTVVRASSW